MICSLLDSGDCRCVIVICYSVHVAGFFSFFNMHGPRSATNPLGHQVIMVFMVLMLLLKHSWKVTCFGDTVGECRYSNSSTTKENSSKRTSWSGSSAFSQLFRCNRTDFIWRRTTFSSSVLFSMCSCLHMDYIFGNVVRGMLFFSQPHGREL